MLRLQPALRRQARFAKVFDVSNSQLFSSLCKMLSCCVIQRMNI